jgi:hypothetical protein
MKTQALVIIVMPLHNMDAPRIQSNLKEYIKGDGVTPFLVHLRILTWRWCKNKSFVTKNCENDE